MQWKVSAMADIETLKRYGGLLRSQFDDYNRDLKKRLAGADLWEMQTSNSSKHLRSWVPQLPAQNPRLTLCKPRWRTCPRYVLP